MKKLKGWGYYSHSKKIFDTERERLESNFIKSKFQLGVFCPNKSLLKEFEYDYTFFIGYSTQVFVSEFEGAIGYGSYKDCLFALENNIPVLVIRQRGKKLSAEPLESMEWILEKNYSRYARLLTKKDSPKKVDADISQK